MKKYLRNKKVILGIVVCSSIVAGALIFMAYRTSQTEPVMETYYNSAYGFSLSFPKHENGVSRVFESAQGMVAFENEDAVRLFEIHVFTTDEWESLQSEDETFLGQASGHVFTYFVPSESVLSEDGHAYIKKSFFMHPVKN